MKYDQASARALLIRTPAVLRAMLEGLPDAWLRAPEEPGAWSPWDVACHVAELEQTAWLQRVHAILEYGDTRPLPAVDREMFRTLYADAPLARVLEDFQDARTRNLESLAALRLDEASLAAMGRHPALGEVRLSQLLSTWVVHDLTHLAQISRALAAQYRQEVGPWIDFLSVLRPRGPAGD